MKKIFFGLIAILSAASVFSQQITGRLKFEQGKTYQINVSSKTTIAQQAMGQAIDFVIDASADHSYKVTNAAEENTTLNHTTQAIKFSSDGMGQKINFDSRNEKDLNGRMGKPVKDMLDKKYDIIVDSGGKVMLAMPEKIVLAETDSRMAIVTNMLRDVLDLVQPPKKGGSSFFKVFPEGSAAAGATWTKKDLVNGGPVESAYVIREINDSTIVVDFAENSTTVSKAEIMATEMTTTMNNKSKGTILIDRATGIIIRKDISTEASGTTEGGFGSIPVTSKSTTVITVKKAEP